MESRPSDKLPVTDLAGYVLQYLLFPEMKLSFLLYFTEEKSAFVFYELCSKKFSDTAFCFTPPKKIKDRWVIAYEEFLFKDNMNISVTDNTENYLSLLRAKESEFQKHWTAFLNALNNHVALPGLQPLLSHAQYLIGPHQGMVQVRTDIVNSAERAETIAIIHIQSADKLSIACDLREKTVLDHSIYFVDIHFCNEASRTHIKTKTVCTHDPEWDRFVDEIKVDPELIEHISLKIDLNMDTHVEYVATAKYSQAILSYLFVPPLETMQSDEKDAGSRAKNRAG